MSPHQLSREFIKHFKITSFFQSPKRGGQKFVYFPVIAGNKLVLKLFPGGLDERFTREMNVYKTFEHLTGIPKIIKTVEFKGELVLFEEFIEGDTLSDITNVYIGNCPLICQLMTDLVITMKPIWEAHYVHRDFKPQNIIIAQDGTPTIIDFGIVRNLEDPTITAAGWQPKSWMFGAPEQFAGDKDKISYRTDFFSLGVIAYFLFHNRLPFGNNEHQVSQKFKKNDEKFITDLGFTLRQFCEETMKFSPSERPRKIDDILNLIL
ncbi:serine/threonine protein kinase [Chryseolinea lacunae]|uniref:Protein kinase n=1 Tax=Chryseolinea lacunae TaxID=2801331 RepID=A0ABS1KTE5_9BACT|nr:protein kinase [Chryseolinea lacunae]MBL0742739.1 protein kinase [Chryseolinea lacunae]